MVKVSNKSISVDTNKDLIKVINILKMKNKIFRSKHRKKDITDNSFQIMKGLIFSPSEVEISESGTAIENVVFAQEATLITKI